VIRQLTESFRHSEKLQQQIRFLYSNGSLYKVHNGNLLFHGCIPMNPDGSLMTFSIGGRERSGRAFMDYADRLARKALGLKPSWLFLRPQHICAPMLKSENTRLYEQMKSEILSSLTRIRNSKNFTQYLYTDYLYLQGKIIPERLSKQHFSVGITSAKRLRRFIEQPSRKLVCVNDVKLSEERYLSLRTTLHEAFEARFPQKSRFEK
jgi:hypothetical protein